MQSAGTIEKFGEKKTPVIALVGNPNTGKSTVFNALCGTRQKVGNYPGVTVEKKEGRALLPETLVKIVDLPGIYSLKASSPDEEVTADIIMGRIQGEVVPDLILYVLDATNIQRNLYLYTQLAEMQIPMVVALTMTDLLEREGIELDIEELQRHLGIPVIPVVGSDRDTLDDLKNELTEYLKKPPHVSIHLDFPKEIEKISGELSRKLSEKKPVSIFEARNLLFFRKDPLLRNFDNEPELLRYTEEKRKQTVDAGYLSPAFIPLKRYEWIEKVLRQVERRDLAKSNSLSQKIDRILTHKIWGFTAFTGIMYAVFQAIYSWAAPLMDLIEWSFSQLSAAVSPYFAAQPVLQSLVVDGVISGVGSVIIFLPQIAILFAFIAVLEDSGYLSRAAFLMDKLLGWTGLSGRSFIPMLSGFACAVPSVMSTRVMSDHRARLTTIMVIPLMSCSARLPVYLLFIGAFIEPVYGAFWAAFSLFAMHAVGPLLALPVAFFMNKGIKTQATPFLLEMPPYRMPNVKNVYYRVYEAVSKFVVRAGTVIFAMSVLIWALSYFPHSASIPSDIRKNYDSALLDSTDEERADLENQIRTKTKGAYLEQSYLGRAGKFIEPVFAPLGFDWKISIGILGAFPAREVIISTLGIIYNVGESDEDSISLKKKMAEQKHPDGSPVFTPLLAVSLMVFFALCSQCMSTLATVHRELNSWGWTIFQFTYMTLLAYIISLMVYQGGRAFGLT